MAKAIKLHEGVIRPSLVAELRSFRAADRLVSTYYLDLDVRRRGNGEAVRIALKDALAGERERIARLDVRPAVRHALGRDLEAVEQLAPTVIGDRATSALACFVAADSNFGRAVRLPWSVRHRAFFEDRFVLWPLRQVLQQADRYALILTDKDDARLFLFFMEQVEEIADVLDEVPGRIRFPDPLKNWHYSHKHVEYFHRHFERVAEAGLRLFEREPFEHLIVGGLSQLLPQFESHLHRYLSDRIVARWDIEVRTPTPQILERARQEEQKVLDRQARQVWKTIQDFRPQRGALGPDEVFHALWGRRVQGLLVEPGVRRPGCRCRTCGRLNRNGGTCVECGGATSEVSDVYDEAVHDAIEQSAQVRYWKDPALHEVGSLAALRRF